MDPKSLQGSSGAEISCVEPCNRIGPELKDKVIGVIHEVITKI